MNGQVNDVDDDGRSMQRGLALVAEWQVATAILVAIVTVLIVPHSVRRDVIGGLAVVLVAMLIGFVPLRVLLRAGPENIVTGWIAAMMLRMAATLIGLVLLLKRYKLDEASCVWTVCGGYLLLLGVETIGMTRLMRREFEKQQPRSDEKLQREDVREDVRDEVREDVRDQADESGER